jgi:GT2 family glycosyltransferase
MALSAWPCDAAGTNGALDIVVPSSGRPAMLRALLASLRTALDATPGMAARIIVTDDRHDAVLATDLAREHPRALYVRGPGRGAAANRNHGARLGRGTWLLFIDDDCLADPTLLSGYSEAAYAYPGAGALQGAVGAAGERPDALHHAPLVDRGGALVSCNVAIRRDLFEALGGFDEAFPHSLEDCELGWRLRAAGQPLPFAPRARVRHPWRALQPREVWREAIGHAIMAARHPGFAAGFGPLDLARMLAGRARGLRRGGVHALHARQWAHAALHAGAPLLFTAAVRAGPLRRWIVRRHAQPPVTTACATAAP